MICLVALSLCLFLLLSVLLRYLIVSSLLLPSSV